MGAPFRVERVRLREAVAPAPAALLVAPDDILEGESRPALEPAVAAELLVAAAGVRRAAAGMGGFLVVGVLLDMVGAQAGVVGVGGVKAAAAMDWRSARAN